MRLNPNTLVIDVKVQDRWRKWLSTLSTENRTEVTSVIFGDSDIDYELAPNVTNSRILSAPYEVGGIKNKLVVNGVGKNLSGSIKSFVRKIDEAGNVLGIYNYPLDEVFSVSSFPPSLENGKDWEELTFTDDKMGYIIFFSTVLDFYFDENGVNQRLVENYSLSIDWDGSPNTNSSYDVVFDEENGSLLISKRDTKSNPISTIKSGTITVTGLRTNKTKKIKFNF